MAIFFVILLEENYLKIDLVKGLQKTFLVIIYLC